MEHVKLENVEAHFAGLKDIPDDQIDLAEAAFLIGAYANPELDVDECRERLSSLVQRIGPQLEDVADECGRVHRLCFVLFQDMGFRGNQNQFYDPQNSHLATVLQRRLGIPISLSVLLMEVARRLDIPLKGVGFPGHFLVRYDDKDTAMFIDAFHGGRVLSEVDCADLLETLGGGKVPFDVDLLQPVTRSHILLRMLRNLKAIHMRVGDTSEALHIMELMLSLSSDDWDTIRDRGIVFSNTGAFRRACEDFNGFLEARPDAPEAMFIRAKLLEVRNKLYTVN
jgi:regulator of sirC expression with transglutaminase-like and TPR domain